MLDHLTKSIPLLQILDVVSIKWPDLDFLGQVWMFQLMIIMSFEDISLAD